MEGKKWKMVAGTELITDAQTKVLSQGETLRDTDREGSWYHFRLLGFPHIHISEYLAKCASVSAVYLVVHVCVYLAELPSG